MLRRRSFRHLCPRCSNCVALILLMAVLAALTATATGCGKRARDLSPVTGKVTYRGQPLRFGAVSLHPESGQHATAAIQPDGSFELSTPKEGAGVPVGKCQVRIVCYENQNPELPPRQPNTRFTLGKSLIPKKYTSCQTSGITVEVRPDKNEPLMLNLTD